MKVRCHIFISGRVQGVFFRAKTEELANFLKVGGWVRNTEDGRVEVLAEGEKEKIDELIKWLKKGPPLAKVTNLDVEWQEYKGEFKNFQIRYD